MPTNKTQTLTALEQLEASQINCGCYVTQVSFADLREQIPSSNLSDSDIREALQQLIDDQEVIEWQPQSYRSRIAETVRILRLLRQRFWNSKSLANSPLLIEDVRVEFRQRYRPNRNAVRVEEAIPTEVKFPARQQFLQVLQAIGFNKFSQFQQRAIQDIFACSQQQNANNDSFIIAGDTGAGKTEAFLFPILLDIINESTAERQHPGVRAVLVYPRIRLARNQLARLLRYIGLLRASGAPPITVGIQNGDTPRNRQAIQEKWSETGYSNRYLVRLLESCIECEEGRYWVERTELEKDCPHLICDRCGHSIDSLYLTQETLSKQAPDILIITDVSLSQWMVRERYTHLWGLWSGEKQTIPPRYLVLDEVHLYEQIKGSHIARLIKRFQSRVRLVYKNSEQPERNPIIIGVSATLNDERAFLAKLLNVSPSDTDSYSKLKVIKPYDNELEDTEGRERYIFICPRRLSPTLKNPEYRVNDQTAAIQIVMAVMHNLKREIEWRGLAFFDSINDLRQFTNNYNSRRDGANSNELWRIRTDARQGRKNLHQGCGGSNCLKCLEDKSLDSCAHFQAGDCWLFAQFGGWNSKLKVADSVYAGSAGELDGTDLIPSSPSLEVGYDDDAIQLVYQHKAPPNAASFIQRRGRAGRSPNDSPIIVTMLWPNRSGDMFYYYHPEALYNPSFDDAPLNANNFNVQRTHTLLAFFDLLACLRVQNIDNLHNDPEIIDFTQAGNELFLISDQVIQSWTPLSDPYRPGQERLLLKHRINKKNIWFSGGQLNHLEQSNESLKVKGWLALDKELTFKVLRRAWEYLSTNGLFDNYLEMSTIASSTFKQHSTYPYQIKKGNTLPNVLDQFGNKEWHSNHDRIEKSNWIKTFRYIDWMLQGKEDATTLIVHYPNEQVANNDDDEQESNEATLDLTFALTELLPGNVSYRLREKEWIHWTPIPKEGESTFLYPTEAEFDEEQNVIGENISYEPKIDDIASQPDSIFGVPRYLDQNFPDLRLMRVQRLRVEKFGRPSDQESPLWYFDPDQDCAVQSTNGQKPSQNAVKVTRRTASYAKSVVIPYIASARSVERRNLGFPLNRLFSTIEGYVTEGTAMLGYTRVFYEMQIDLKTTNRNENKTLQRKFYPPNPDKDDSGNPQPILVGYSLETQGITFHLNYDLLNELTQTVLNDDQLRLSFRKKMALYHFSSYATENKLFMKTVIELAEVVVDYWLHEVIPSSKNPRLLNFSTDIQPLKNYYGNYRNIKPANLTEFQQIVNDSFINKINQVLVKSFKNTQDFYDFIKSTALHSLSSLLKTLIARLGGVSSEDLVAYADLPILEKVDKGINPRIIIMDKVEGGSGAIAQAFERLELSAENEENEASLWWILQRDLGQCPIAQGEAVVQNVLTQASEEQIKSAQDHPNPQRIENLLDQLGLSTPSQAIQRLGRTLFSDLSIGEYNINPALIIKELTELHNQLNSQIPGTYPREAVVCQAVKTLEANTYPHIYQLRNALQDNGADPDDLDNELAVQLKSIYANTCEDGCPVCMSEGSDIEHHQLASLLRSRKVLNKLREQLFKQSPTSDCLANLADSLRDGESVQVKSNTNLLEDNKIHPQLGIATLQKVNETGELNGSIITPLNEVSTNEVNAIPNDDVWRERWEKDEYKPYPLPPDGQRRVRSRGEYIIATQLINENIAFDYESPISYRSDDGTVRRIHPDFYLFEYGLYVEYWGLNDAEYLESRRFKEKVYKKRKIKPINIEKDEIENNRFMDKIKRRISEEIEAL